MTYNRLNFEKNWIWDFAETIALEKYYIQLEGRPIAEKPAFLTVYYPERKAYALFMNKVGLIGFYPTLTKLHRKLKEIVESANFPLKLWKDKNKHPFAVNRIQRVAETENPVRVFNIPEWEVEV